MIRRRSAPLLLAGSLLILGLLSPPVALAQDEPGRTVQPGPDRAQPQPEPAPPTAEPQPPPPGYPPPTYPPPAGYPAPPPGYMPVQPAPYGGPPPSKGTGLIVAGAVLIGVGGITMLTSPIFLAFDYSVFHDLGRTYFYTMLAIGGIMAAVGTPLLIVGVAKRRQYNQWRMANPAMAALLEGLSVTPLPQHATVGWGIRF